MYILANMWFTKLIKQFFFWIDKIVFNFISIIYDLMISIARTSVLSQADIVDMADRIYTLLLIFMVFKVTLSLITYTVNPDDFTDKSKGVAKLGQKIIISLALLILTPYIFNYAYQFQTIILEDNSLATLIFGENTDDRAFLNSAGDEMAFLTFSAFLSPNLALDDMHVCSKLVEGDKFNPECESQLADRLDSTTFVNYKAAIENDNLGLLLRQDLVLATTDDNTEFVMDYKFIFSTVVGIIIILLLLTFCMDVAVRSIKLAFLQLVAPIPILSYVDPKGGKDGMFKKWYEMCFKTFLSLFIRLLALYFAVYIISKVADLKLVDIVDGSYQTNLFIRIFIIIGALMFAKQLPKILEGLGIKLDGDGKFTLNPIKKLEEGALGGKRITGAVGGMAAGLIGGRGVAGRMGGIFSGAARGALANKGYKGGLERQADANRKLREARINGAGFFGSRLAAMSGRYGLDNAVLETESTNLRQDKLAYDRANREVEEVTKSKERRKKVLQDSISQRKKSADAISKVQSSGKAVLDFAKDEVRKNKGGAVSVEYNKRTQIEKLLSGDNVGKTVTEAFDLEYFDATANSFVTKHFNAGDTITMDDAKLAAGSAEAYLAKSSDFTSYVDGLISSKSNAEFNSKYSAYTTEVTSLGDGTISSQKTAKGLKTQTDDLYKRISDIREDIRPEEDEIARIEDEIRNAQVSKRVEISGVPNDVSLEEARDIIAKREQEIKEKKDRQKTNADAAAARRYWSGK